MDLNTRRNLFLGITILAFGVIIALLAVAIVDNTRAAQEADYRACLTAAGVYETDSITAMTEAADRCMTAVYGE